LTLVDLPGLTKVGWPDIPATQIANPLRYLLVTNLPISRSRHAT
jgi:hypothetical protein